MNSKFPKESAAGKKCTMLGAPSKSSFLLIRGTLNKWVIVAQLSSGPFLARVYAIRIIKSMIQNRYAPFSIAAGMEIMSIQMQI